MDLEALEQWLSFERRSKASVEQILEDIASAIKDYSRVFPPPCGLAPNLQLASEASAALTALLEERGEAMDSQGLPRRASLEELIHHHRANAALAATMAAFSLGGDVELDIEDRLKLTDEEWRAFQKIPEQGYSHRAWVDARIKERVALTLAQFVTDRA